MHLSSCAASLLPWAFTKHLVLLLLTVRAPHRGRRGRNIVRCCRLSAQYATIRKSAVATGDLMFSEVGGEHARTLFHLLRGVVWTLVLALASPLASSSSLDVLLACSRCELLHPLRLGGWQGPGLSDGKKQCEAWKSRAALCRQTQQV